MPAINEPRSGLLYGWNLGEHGWNTGMDANLLKLGRFGFHLSARNRTQTAPPSSVSAGDTYIVGEAATGAWAGHSKEVAVWTGAAWAFAAPRIGWVAYIEDEEKLSAFKAGGWSAGVAI